MVYKILSREGYMRVTYLVGNLIRIWYTRIQRSKGDTRIQRSKGDTRIQRSK